MHFTSAVLASGLALIGSSSAKTLNVVVGNGSLAFEPNTTIASVGDTVIFHYYPRMHNVVSGPFDTPCQSTSGIYSGFVPSTSGQANRTFHVTINNTDPIWFYCSQKTNSHCSSGMVGVINPPSPSTNRTLANYKLAAAKIANTSYTQPSAVSGGVLVLRTNGTSTTATSSGAATATSGASTSTMGASTTSAGPTSTGAGGGAATTTSARPSTTTGAAVALGAAKWGVGAVAGGLAVLLL